MATDIISETRLLHNTRDEVVGVYTKDGKGLLTGPQVYLDGKAVGFIDSEYIDLSFRNGLLESMGITRHES